ncbi:MAG TPA: hypothetical protein VMQ81_04920 [Acidimicrobiia bacterium]|nr:hypothetical protein [Acidimicrobiia bacterium]
MPDELDDLADVPPEEFVAARDALARRLKAEGKADEAAAVKQRRKPAVAQWIAAQVRRHHGDVVDAFRASLNNVAEAQETAITSGDRDALRRATENRRLAFAALGQAVDEVIARSDRPTHHHDEVLSAIESDVAGDVASGTFGVRDDLELPELPTRETPRDRVAERRAATAEAAIAAAEGRVSRAREELTKAEAELEAVMERYQ